MNWKYNLGLKFKDIAQKNSNKLAIIIDNKRYNYKYLENKSFKVSKYFMNNLKLRPGDVVALDSTKCIATYIFLIACLKSCAISIFPYRNTIDIIFQCT